MAKKISHLVEHTYAFVTNGVVENVTVFADHDDELATLIAKSQGHDEAVDCCANGIAYMGGTWDGVEFKPLKPFESWIWDTEANLWSAPVAYPDDNEVYYWDEEFLSWNKVNK